MALASAEQTILADGRIELIPEVDASLDQYALHNEDLAPVPIAKRTWTTYNYLALWVGMSINIPSWALAAGLINLGMDWVQDIPRPIRPEASSQDGMLIDMPTHRAR